MKGKELLRISLFYRLLLLLVLLCGILVLMFEIPLHSMLGAGFTTPIVEAEADMPRTPTEASMATTGAPGNSMEIPEEYTRTDVDALITIEQPSDISERRRTLIRFLWGQRELPASLPSVVLEDYSDPRYQDVRSLRRIDKLLIRMEFGLESNVYHFIPEHPNGKVILYHQGHRGDFIRSQAKIERLLEHGYATVAFCMPLLGLNNQPTIQLRKVGRLKMRGHDHMKFLSPSKGHPIKYFIEPIVSTLNYLENDFEYTSVSMTGVSGGGWSTVLAAAADTRITKSFPVAGSYPIYLRSNSRTDWGDYEQTTPELYNTVNYLDLYILGGHGIGRKQLQIVNKYDPCCFAGTKWATFKDTVRQRVRQLGSGEFDLFLDDSHREHEISSVAMSRILDELDRK